MHDLQIIVQNLEHYNVPAELVRTLHMLYIFGWNPSVCIELGCVFGI